MAWCSFFCAESAVKHQPTCVLLIQGASFIFYRSGLSLCNSASHGTRCDLVQDWIILQSQMHFVKELMQLVVTHSRLSTGGSHGSVVSLIVTRWLSADHQFWFFPAGCWYFFFLYACSRGTPKISPSYWIPMDDCWSQSQEEPLRQCRPGLCALCSWTLMGCQQRNASLSSRLQRAIRLIPAALCRWRRCFLADQLWFMTHIRE